MSVKKLGFGLMRLPAVDEADKSKVDVERVCHRQIQLPGRRLHLF